MTPSTLGNLSARAVGCINYDLTMATPPGEINNVVGKTGRDLNVLATSFIVCPS